MVRKRRGFKGRHMIVISAILFLNIIGVGYGYWNDGLQMKTSISTGKIEVALGECNIEGDGLVVSLVDNTIIITGKVPAGYMGGLDYSICNIGSIPILIEGERVEPQGESNTISLPIEAGPDHVGTMFIGDSLTVEQFNE